MSAIDPPIAAPDAEALGLLRRISAQLDALPAAIAAALAAALAAAPSTRRRRPPLSEAHREGLEIVLPPIRELMGISNFIVRQVIERTARDPALRDAVARAIGPREAGREQRLGLLLRSGEGHDVTGLRVERVGIEHKRAIWIVEIAKGGVKGT